MSDAFILWTCGKDAFFALDRAIAAGLRPRLLLTFIDRTTGLTLSGRIPPELVEEQARLLGIPVQLEKTTWSEYHRDTRNVLFDLRSAGITRGVFGDLFERPARDWIELRLAEVDMRGVFPLWGLPPSLLAERQIDLMKSTIVRIDRKKISESYLGRDFDHAFVDYLVERGMAPVGESGLYATFVRSSPLMRRDIVLTHAERRATPESVELDIDFWQLS